MYCRQQFPIAQVVSFVVLFLEGNNRPRIQQR